MSTLQNFTDSIKTYYPAELAEGSDWFVRYYVLDPFTGKMVRKRIKINRVKNIAERRRYARQLIIDINKKLENGWNPFVESDTTKTFHKLLDALDTYYNIKKRDLEKHTLRSYRSFLDRISDYVKEIDENMYCGNFTKSVATNFMLHLKTNEKVCNRTYNNYLQFYRTLFNWLIQFDYVSANPFATMQKIAKKYTKKKRKYLDRDELHALIELLQGKNDNYLAACMLIYYCLLRPGDLSCLRLSSFDFKKNLIFIKSEETKNDNDSYRVIPVALEKYLNKIHWERITSKDYIFSDSKTFAPGKKQLDSREFARYWNKIVRPGCDFGMEKQFYSLKDSGITNLISDGISPVYVQGQADHSSLEITNIYTHKHTPDGFLQLRNLAKEI